MKNKKNRLELSYNSQITVDRDSGIIVANDVTQDPTDHHQLKPQIESMEENLGGLPERLKMSFDNGYYSGSNLQYLEKRGIDGYIPDNKQAQKMKGKKHEDNPYSKDKFGFDAEKDCFICPQGEVLSIKRKYNYNGKVQYSYSGANCHKCPDQVKCAGKGKAKVITSVEYEAERRRMAAKMQSEDGKEEYKKRKETVEWPFGNIKQNLNFREFLTRGIERVKTEHNLVSTAHNLKIIWKKLEGNVAGLGNIRSVVTGLVSNLASPDH